MSGSLRIPTTPTAQKENRCCGGYFVCHLRAAVFYYLTSPSAHDPFN